MPKELLEYGDIRYISICHRHNKKYINKQIDTYKSSLQALQVFHRKQIMEDNTKAQNCSLPQRKFSGYVLGYRSCLTNYYDKFLEKLILCKYNIILLLNYTRPTSINR